MLVLRVRDPLQPPRGLLGIYRAGEQRGRDPSPQHLSVGPVPMTDKPPSSIVHTNYRPKRARKRKQSPAIPMRIVTAKQPKPQGPAIDQAVTERKRPAQAVAITGPRIVTAKPKRSTRFGPVQEIDAEEHRRRGDAAVALFRGARAAGYGRWQDVRLPSAYWRSYGTDPGKLELLTGIEGVTSRPVRKVVLVEG